MSKIISQNDLDAKQISDSVKNFFDRFHVSQLLKASYGYDYLGTLEQGPLYQKLYDYLDQWLWETYCSDEEFEPYDYLSDHFEDERYEGYYGSYVAVKKDLHDFFTDEEFEILDGYQHENQELDFNWDLLNYWFFYNNPIYYFSWTEFGPNGVVKENIVHVTGEDASWPKWTGNIIILAMTNLGDSDLDNMYYISNYGDVDFRRHVRNMVEKKLHEYYDVASQYDTAFEKEVALQNKMNREVYYSYQDLTSTNVHTFIGVFEEDKAVCEGYSTAFSMICNYCGVDCIYGYGGTTAERYAIDQDYRFYDLTGKTVIDEINIDLDYSNLFSNGIESEISKTNEQLSGYGIEVVDIYVPQENDLNEKYIARILVKAKDGFAITPNTLANVNGDVAYLFNLNPSEVYIYCSQRIKGEARIVGELRCGNCLNIKVNNSNADILKYQWFKNGEVEGSTENYFVMEEEDYGKQVTITCKVSSENYEGILTATITGIVQKGMNMDAADFITGVTAPSVRGDQTDKLMEFSFPEWNMPRRKISATQSHAERAKRQA